MKKRYLLLALIFIGSCFSMGQDPKKEDYSHFICGIGKGMLFTLALPSLFSLYTYYYAKSGDSFFKLPNFIYLSIPATLLVSIKSKIFPQQILTAEKRVTNEFQGFLASSLPSLILLSMGKLQEKI